MPVTVDLNPPNNTTLEYAGLTSGNGQIVAVPDRARSVFVTYTPTSAGTASIKVGNTAGRPTDFTNMPKTVAGDVTATGYQDLPVGVRWIGLDPASGTWTMSVSYKML
jgi:hypothetical protein